MKDYSLKRRIVLSIIATVVFFVIFSYTIDGPDDGDNVIAGLIGVALLAIGLSSKIWSFASKVVSNLWYFILERIRELAKAIKGND